ncbi:hypothetical protein EJ08DRAFT_413933 [Tothia fuscella]|uniref:Uncharacterized protein n=1 Tax=Tothia fuscella TaxID=1048955 RepID=A0A9P4NK16_9PEZI|nr:hypothetical protein EJ08DRAFT_413933 [Tothia fuscella]
MGLFARIAGIAAATTATPALAWAAYTSSTIFVPFGTSSPDYTSSISKKINPASNPPVCIDHAIRTIPLSKLKTTDQEELTRSFCQGVWSGAGFEIQRRYLARKYRALNERDDHLWDKIELKMSNYEVGTKIADHFEVVERNADKVTVRCGDSPLKQKPRPSDGLFSMEVTKDEKNATFHLKSMLFNSTPDGAGASPDMLPFWFDFLHKQYVKLWMETSVRRLLK